jgi:hypothetical protein
MPQFTAIPAAFADIYPFEGGVYSVHGNNGGMLALETDKSLKGSFGTFNITLEDGGPLGLNARPTWLETITTMSLVVIGMARMGRAKIVMIGVVRNVSADTAWIPGKGVRRVIKVAGDDFGYFFSLQNYYVQSLLNFSLQGVLGAAGSLAVFQPNALAGTPASVGQQWYEKIMAGPNSIMAKLTFQYQNGRVGFYDLVATWWETLAADSASVQIPFGDNFMVAGGNWISKFLQIFPFPWYEFFVTTGDIGEFPAAQRMGSGLSVQSMPYAAAAAPQVVARVNPLPRMRNTGTTSTPQFTTDMTRWNALPLFSLDSPQFQQSFSFSDDEMRNFYMIDPLWISNQIGVDNAMQTPFAYLFNAWLDEASVHRYGFRPDISDLHWFYDPNGLIAQSNAAAGVGIPEYDGLIEQLAAVKFSYHEPTPNMLSGALTTNLRPDITIGSKLRANPYKDPQPWLFYIEQVSHKWAFGNNAATQLGLSRGLPESVYSDDAMMVALHTGNAERVDGEYLIGLPPGLGDPIKPINYQNAQQLTGSLAAIFTQAQAK